MSTILFYLASSETVSLSIERSFFSSPTPTCEGIEGNFLSWIGFVDAGVHFFREIFEIFLLVKIRLRSSGKSLSQNFPLVCLDKRRNDIAGINWIIFGGILGLFGRFFVRYIKIWLFVRPVDQRTGWSLPRLLFLFLFADSFWFFFHNFYLRLFVHFLFHQIVHSSYMIMPIVDDICPSLNRVKIKLSHPLNDIIINRDSVFANNYSFAFMRLFAYVIPFRCSNLGDFESRLWIDIENISQDISWFGSEEFGHLKITSHNLFIELVCVGIFKWQITT